MAKRIYRNDMAQTQRDKIAAANVGKTLSQETKRKISIALQKYWASLPEKPEDNDDGTTTTGTTGTTRTQLPTDLNPFRDN